MAQTPTVAWQAEAALTPVETREEVASNVVDVAEWMANDLAVDRSDER